MNGPSRPSPCANTFGSVYSGRRLMNQLRNFWNRDEDSGTNRAILQVCLTHRHRQAHRQTGRHTQSCNVSTQTGTQTYRQTDRQIHRQTDTQADTHRQAHRRTGRHIQKSGFSSSTTVWWVTSRQPASEWKTSPVNHATSGTLYA